MPKQAKKLTFRLPPYGASPNVWRRLIYGLAQEAQKKAGVKYTNSDRLAVKISLYMPDADLVSHDIDNRMKDVFDALQGRAGGSKAIHTLRAIIPNDRQIFRVEMEKSKPPKQSGGFGHVHIRILSGSKKSRR